jgi:hypothetical protein
MLTALPIASVGGARILPHALPQRMPREACAAYCSVLADKVYYV